MLPAIVVYSRGKFSLYFQRSSSLFLNVEKKGKSTLKSLRTLSAIVMLAFIFLLASRSFTTLAASSQNDSPIIGQTASAASNSCGSWQDMHSPSVNGQLYGIAAISHTDIWAVGYSIPSNGPIINSAIIEHWNGTLWSLIPSPQPGNYRNFLEKVAALSPSNVWAVGAYQNAKGGFQEPQKTLIEHWNGTSWHVIASPNPKAFSTALFGIAALSATNIWSMGVAVDLHGSSKTLIEHWNGTQWSIVSTPDPGAYSDGLGSVAALSSNDIWSVGSFSSTKFGLSQTLTEHWDGKQWNVVPSPNIGTLGDGLESVTAISPQDIWAVGWYAYHAPDGQEQLATMTDHWNGSQWSVIPSPNPPGGDNTLHGVTSLATNEVWAVGTSAVGPIADSWDGHQWNAVPTPGPTYRWLWSIIALSPHDLWSVGSIALKGLIMHYC